MQTILVANPKGGSGKTTLATNVAGWLAGRKRDVILRDLDPQRSATEWLQRRPELFPSIAGLTRDAKGNKEPEHDWRVIDTPAGLHGEDLREAVRRAGVMLVPLTPSAFDMGATRHFLEAINEYKAIRKGELALGIIAMRVDPRTHSAAELDAFLKEFDFPVVTHPARHAGLCPLRPRRRVGVRSTPFARRAGLGAMEAADAMDYAARTAAELIAVPGRNRCRGN